MSTREGAKQEKRKILRSSYLSTIVFFISRRSYRCPRLVAARRAKKKEEKKESSNYLFPMMHFFSCFFFIFFFLKIISQKEEIRGKKSNVARFDNCMINITVYFEIAYQS